MTRASALVSRKHNMFYKRHILSRSMQFQRTIHIGLGWALVGLPHYVNLITGTVIQVLIPMPCPQGMCLIHHLHNTICQLLALKFDSRIGWKKTAISECAVNGLGPGPRINGHKWFLLSGWVQLGLSSNKNHLKATSSVWGRVSTSRIPWPKLLSLNAL